jgi:hypothetical protein
MCEKYDLRDVFFKSFQNISTVHLCGLKYQAIIFIKVVFHPPETQTNAVFCNPLISSENLSKTFLFV